MLIGDWPLATMVPIDDDVLEAAENLAAERHLSVGEVISSLSRAAPSNQSSALSNRSGFPLLPMRDPTPVTLEHINQMRDEANG